MTDPDILRFLAGCVIGMTDENAPDGDINRARGSYVEHCMDLLGLSEQEARGRLAAIERAAEAEHDEP